MSDDQLNPEELLAEYSQEQQSSGQESNDDIEIDVKGKKYKASQIEEYEKGYMKDADYRRKTQALAEEKRQYEAQMQEYNQLKQYIGVIQQRDPYFLAQAQRILQGQPQQDQYADDPYMQAIRQTQQYVQSLGQRQQELATKQSLFEIKEELTALRSKYPKMDEKTVLAAVASNPNMDMEEVARLSHEDMTQRVRQEIESLSEQRRRQRKAMVEGTGGRTAGVTQPTAIPKNKEELTKAVTERLRILGM